MLTTWWIIFLVTTSMIDQDLRSKDTGRESRLWARWLPTMLSRLPARQEGRVPTTSLEEEEAKLSEEEEVTLLVNNNSSPSLLLLTSLDSLMMNFT